MRTAITKADKHSEVWCATFYSLVDNVGIIDRFVAAGRIKSALWMFYDLIIDSSIYVEGLGITSCNGGYCSFEGGCVDGGGCGWIYDTSAQKEEGGQG